MKWRPGAVLLPALWMLGGCSAAGGIAGGVTGIATGAATANPAVGYAVSVGVEAATDSLVNYIMRSMHQDEQDAISKTAGTLPIGQSADWKIEHSLPFKYGDAHGTVQPVRDISSSLARCREVALTVIEKKDSRTFLTTICDQTGQWKWALAEPAVARWGALQ